MHFATQEDKKLLLKQIEKAHNFMLAQIWFLSVKDVMIGRGIEGIFFSFLVEVEPAFSNVPKLLWVVTGDLPPAFLSVDHVSEPFEALLAYTVEMDKWVQAAKTGSDVSKSIPVNVPATVKRADALQSRLEFIRCYLMLENDVPEVVRKHIQKDRKFELGQ